ncbi:Rab family GTPase [Entamoeba marina]
MNTFSLLKIGVVGDSSVGKTSIVSRFLFQSFELKHVSTVGADFYMKNFFISDKTKLKLHIWDTSGVDKYHNLVPSYLHGIDVCLFVFDITNPESFHSISYWHEKIVSKNTNEKVVCYLVGNKIDLTNDHSLLSHQVRIFGKEKNMKVFYASALSNENVDNMFKLIVNDFATKEKVNKGYAKLNNKQKKGKALKLRKFLICK